MRPGTRVVSHQYDMGEWRPDQRQQIGASTIFLWVVPARVEGQWRISAEGRTVTVDLTQDFQQVDGRISGGGTGRAGTADRQPRSASSPIWATAGASMIGRVNGDRIESLQPNRGWQAVRAS